MAKKTPPTIPTKRQMASTDAPKTPERASGEQPDLVKVWGPRLTREDKIYDEWAKEYEVERCEKYYLGKQWHGLAKADAEKKYAINLVFATVETQLPSLMFARPKVTIEPQPEGLTEQPGSDSAGRANTIQSTLQTFIDKPSIHFGFQTTLALRDTYWRFGVIEVGYTNDYIDNPNADRPVQDDNGKDMIGSDGQPVLQPKRVLKNHSERLFLKRIPPRSFRVSPGRNQLETNDFVAYFEWFSVSDVKANPEYENTADLRPTGQMSDQSERESENERDRRADQVKLWKIYDLREKVRHVYAEGHKKLLQTGKPFKFLPFAPLKFYEIADAWYPLPPLFNWIKPQDEINESREGQRTHRKRFIRRYMREPSVKAEEFDKLEAGEDGVCIEVPKVNPSPIAPIPDAELGQSNWEQLAATKEDYMEITGVSGEARGVPQADTATQANIINVRAQLRESSARVLVAGWLANIARLMLLTLREKMQAPFLVKMNVDPFAPAPKETARTASEWKEIKAADLDLDVDVTIDIASLSPVAEDASRAQWNIVLGLLSNPPLMAVLMTPNPESPADPSPLLRKTLSLNGVKSEQEVREIWRIGQAALQAQAASEQAKATASARQDLPHTTYGFKGEDLANPIVLAAFVRAEGLQNQAAAIAQAAQQAPAPSVPSPDSASSGTAPAPGEAPGAASGIPDKMATGA